MVNTPPPPTAPTTTTSTHNNNNTTTRTNYINSQTSASSTMRAPLTAPSTGSKPDTTTPEQRAKEAEQGVAYLRKAIDEASKTFARLQEGDEESEKLRAELLLRAETIRARQRVQREREEGGDEEEEEKKEEDDKEKKEKKNDTGCGKDDSSAECAKIEAEVDERKEE
ncbi:hypothetical protein IWX50DRAFT_682132 [Phyllosticta citricarpa]